MFNAYTFENMPGMPKRENSNEKFSTYLTLETSSGQINFKWKYESRLKRNLDLYQQKNHYFSQLCQHRNKRNDLAQFWVNIALQETQIIYDWEPENRKELALEHLGSYCEETCYWSAKEVWKECKELSWEEYLCIARLFVYNTSKFLNILTKFNRETASLDTYIKKIIIAEIKTVTSVGKFSRWRLLCEKSNKELQEALQRLGRCEPEISCLIFARKCFKQVYLINTVKAPNRKSGQKWPEPKNEDFQVSAHCYNAEKSLPDAPHEVFANSNTINGEQMQSWMGICLQALQEYRKPRPVEPPESPPVDPRSPDPEEPGPRTDSALRQQLATLEPDLQKVLFLYYGVRLSQTRLAGILGVNQATISRYLTRLQVKLLKTVASLSQPNEWVQQYVEGWLERNYPTPQYSNLIHATLVAAIKKLETQETELLRLRYGQHLNDQEIAARLGIQEIALITRLKAAKHYLQSELIATIDKWIKDYLEKWLFKHYQSLVNSACQDLGIPLDIELETEKINELVERYLRDLPKLNQ